MRKSLFIGLFFPVFVFSQNLNELILISLENKNVAASQENIKSIQEEYESAKSGYMPSISVGGSYTDTSHESAAMANNALRGYIDVSYSIYDGGKKDLTYQTYESRVRGAQKDLFTLKNQISLDVVNRYFNYLSYSAQKEAKLQEIEQLNAQHQRLSKFLEAGTTTIDELDKIISRVESANVELHELDLNIQTILHELEYITGKKVSIHEGSYIQMADESAELRSDIKSLEHSMQTLLLNAKSVKTANNIQVTLNDTYTYYENNYNNSAYDNGIEDQNVFSLNFSWKIFDFGANEKSYESAYRSFLSTKSTYEYEKNKANVDLDLAKKSYEISKLKIKSAKANLHASQSTYKVTKQKYENGLVDNVTYLEALSELSDAQSSLSSAKYELEVKKANVIYQKGKNVWEFVQ